MARTTRTPAHGRPGRFGPRWCGAVTALLGLATACTIDFDLAPNGVDSGSAGISDADSDSDSNGDGSVPGAPDAAPATDAAPIGGSCDLVGQTGCAATQKCAWIYTNPATGAGAPGCYPDGTAALGAPCARPSSAGEADDCVKGAHCNMGDCKEICSTSPYSPCSSGSCAAPEGVPFEICLESCDPLGQNCAPGEGCYLNAAGPVCAEVAWPGIGLGGPCEWSNDCLPGSGCFEGAGIRVCRAYCNHALYPDINDPSHCAPFETCWGLGNEPIYGVCAF